MIGEDLCPSEEEVRDIEIGWKEGKFPSPRVSSSPPPSGRFLLLSHRDHLVDRQRCHRVCNISVTD